MKLFAFEKSAGAVLFSEENGERKYLLLHYLSGHWDFPKGHVEKGETEEEAVKREVLEETGISEIEIIAGFRKNIFYSYRTGANERKKKNGIRRVFKKVSYYVAITRGEKVSLSGEHKGYEWLEYEKALERVTHEEGRRVLAKADKFLEK